MAGATDASRLDWFVEARFGLFIHWGLYSLAARHEWVQQREEVPAEEYARRYFDKFDPDLYDPEEWAEIAADAGMRYFVVTTKHHEGFCLWDSKLTDFKAPNTPARRDLLRPMIEAFRKRGLKVGLYYSLIDWHHPDFVIDSHHPLRNHPARKELNKRRDQKRYIAYLHGQVRELLTEYGKVDLIFFDFSYPVRPARRDVEREWQGKGRNDWDSLHLIEMVRQLQPHILVNDRLDLHDVPGAWDYVTPEQIEPREWPTRDGKRVPWETCKTFSGSWGYHRDEATWKSSAQIISILIDTVSKGGNLLLNVGPTARGELDPRAVERLREVGRWMKRHGRAIYGCTAPPEEFAPPRNCVYTWNPKTRRLYVHVFDWPVKHLHLDGLAGRVEYAQLLNDGSELKLEMSEWFAEQMRRAGHTDPRTLTLEVPVRKPDPAVPVIELFLK